MSIRGQLDENINLESKKGNRNFVSGMNFNQQADWFDFGKNNFIKLY